MLADVAYIDKHPQPSGMDGGHADMPNTLSAYHGNLTAVNLAQQVPRAPLGRESHLP